MLRSLTILKRLMSVALTLARYDVLFLFEQLGIAPAVVFAARLVPVGRVRGIKQMRPGQRLARALQDLGPTAIKLGQALSTRPDVMGDEIAEDLTELQDRLPPFSGAQARKIIEEDLGAPIEEIFSEFNDEAIAAASIAQVHFARLSNGDEVAVKVLRPHIRRDFKADFQLMSTIAQWVERARPDLLRLKLVESVDTLEDTVRFEMDLRFEAAAADEMRENFKDDDYFYIPEVKWAYCAKRVMVLERIRGVNVDEVEEIKKLGHNPNDILEKASTAFFNMVFRDGFFHADLHPGNMFVLEDGTLAAVDFGITGRLDHTTQRHLGELLLSFLTRDYKKCARVHFEAGWVPLGQSEELFTQAARSIAEPIMGLPQNEISMARLLAQLFEVTEYFSMETQPQLIQLQKTMLIAEGVGRNLNPNVNMWFLAEPFIESWMRQNLGPQAKVKAVADETRETLMRLPRIIANIEHTLEDIGKNGLKLDTSKRRPAKSAVSFGWISWVISAGLAAALAFEYLG
ncbi:2-polyprenylphenol 6-hydroxylase [Terasakiella sp. SH-1]|uniref:2-polyprenylphenol 6-hydroxylase n=1 Tax=Terasakiella sp. SH-1 TaxID=2560057 RepID=UPI001073CDF4|nr:2-polyprenylphenol 6-hydroxylase [Terasakiella sp. SH-1]